MGVMLREGFFAQLPCSVEGLGPKERLGIVQRDAVSCISRSSSRKAGGDHGCA